VQVRRSLGGVLALVLSNLHLYHIKHQVGDDISEQTCILLINKAVEATKFIIDADSAVTNSSSLATVKMDESLKKKTKDYVRQMETVCFYNSIQDGNG
jgi:hypothetical protein